MFPSLSYSRRLPCLFLYQKRKWNLLPDKDRAARYSPQQRLVASIEQKALV